MEIVLQLLTLLGSVTLFLFGLNLLSGGLQKVAGNGLRAVLASMTSSRIKRILTGIGVTAVIQSSTATTIMVVSFVNAGLLTLAQAIGVIMGANIGTTVTSWMMAVFGFSFDVATVAFPLIAVGFIMLQSRKHHKFRDVGEIIIGFALFFIGFANLKSTASVLLDGINLEGLHNWTHFVVGSGSFSINLSVLLFLLIGTVMTIAFQSSAATMAIIMLLITTGTIPFEMAAAMILGENIGTTIAANIAASVGNTSAKRSAMAHTVFNVFGVIWVLCIFYPFIRLIGHIVAGFGLPNPMDADFTQCVPGSPEEAKLQSSLLYSVTTLHTLFNVINTCVLVWFIPQIEAVVKKIIKNADKGEEVYRLKFIQGGPLSTAELSLDEAKHEIIHFAEICYNDFGYIRSAINAVTKDEMSAMEEKLVKYEEITDKVEYEIATYLSEVSKGEVSQSASRRIKGMYKIIGEMESLGDSGESISRILKRQAGHERKLDEEMLSNLNSLMDRVDAAFRAMIDNLRKPYTQLTDITNAEQAEVAINEYRNKLREQHIANIENIEKETYNYQTGVYYIDIVAELEKMGDFIINVSQAQMAENQ